VYDIAEREKESLLEAMRSFQKSAKGTIDVDINSKKYQKWSDVEATMKAAESDYLQRHKGPMKGIQSFFDNVGSSGDTFQAWLSLLPDGEYSSVVCGAFKLVIKVSSRLILIFHLNFKVAN
jgi:hypothetical protein